MSNCPIAAWIVLKKATDLLNNGFYISFYNLILNQVKDYIYDQIGVAEQMIVDTQSMLVSVAAAIENAVGFAGSPREWASYILNEQVNVYKDSLDSEIVLLNITISNLVGMQERLRVDPNKYVRKSRTMHRWLKSSYDDLTDCIETSGNISNYNQNFSSSYNKMRIIQAMLDFKGRRKSIDRLMGNIKRNFGDTIENKGDPIRKVDYAGEMKDIINDRKNDAVDAINFIDNWIYFLSSYIVILKSYSGADLAAYIDPFIGNLETLLSNAEETNVVDWSITNLSSGIDWSKCIKEISIRTLFPGKSNQTIIGNKMIRSGSNDIITLVMATLGDAEVSTAVWAGISTELKNKAIELQQNEIFQQIKVGLPTGYGDAFTASGENNDGNYLMESRGDQLKQLLRADRILLDYKLADQVLIANAVTEQQTEAFLEAIEEAFEEISDLQDQKISTVLFKRPNAYKDDVISEFMEEADMKGLAVMMELGAATVIGNITYESLQTYIDYFVARRSIISKYREIMKNIPAYRNATIAQLIETLGEFGFTNLVNNLREGVFLFDQASIASTIGLSSEMIAMASALEECIDVAKTPEQLKQIAKLVGSVKTHLTLSSKLAFEKGINGILKVTGLKFDWIKRMLSKSEDTEQATEILAYVRTLMGDIV